MSRLDIILTIISAFFYTRIWNTECLGIVKPLGLYYFKYSRNGKWVLKRKFKTICSTTNYKEFMCILKGLLEEEGYAI